MAAKQKGAEELQGLGAGAASSSSVLQQSNLEVFSHTDDKLRKSNPDEGQDSREKHDTMMEKLCEYLKLTKACVDGIQIMPPSKFNNEQCGYLFEKLETTFERARSHVEECQAQPSRMCSIMNMERQAKTFKLLMVSGKQVEGFFQECGMDAWIQTAMTLANVGEYVSSIGFNLELCKVALSEKDDVTESLTKDEVSELNANEVKTVKKKALVDEKTLLDKVIEVHQTLNAQDLELAKYLMFKLNGNMANPSFAKNNSNVIIKLFEWVKNVGGRGEQIGRGASARVYKVMWFGIPVAKKTFDGPNVEGFLQEVKVLSQLHHPNITSMFCCDMNKRECSIVMELMDGSLYDLLRSRVGEDSEFLPFSDLEGLNLMLQVGEGVEYLHRKKIVHRDLKSANILVKKVEVLETGDESVLLKVVDFGLSKTKASSMSSSSMTYNVGSSRWMAPEIIQSNEVNQEVHESFSKLPKYNFKGDIYSLGMVFMEILTGEVPFQSIRSERVVKEMVLEGKRPPLPKYCIPRVGELIMKCCSQEPNKRPSIVAVCLELKYLKYSLLTSGFSQGCPSLSMQRLHEVDEEKDHEINGAREYSKAEMASMHLQWKESTNFIKSYYSQLPSGEEVIIYVVENQQGLSNFAKLVGILSKIHHKNVMSLVGYCSVEQEWTFLYEYIKEPYSLFNLISEEGAKGLEWKTRINIGLQAARGLEYLHTECSPSVIHGNVNSKNIYINSEIEAKLFGFDLQQLIVGIRLQRHVPENEYPDTKYENTDENAAKGDVYNFGVVLLQLITGRPPYHIVEWVQPFLWRDAIIEILDRRALFSNVDAVLKVIDVAMLCLTSQRPSMSEVVVGLRHALELEENPSMANPTDVAAFARHKQLTYDGEEMPKLGGQDGSVSRDMDQYPASEIVACSKDMKELSYEEIFASYQDSSSAENFPTNVQEDRTKLSSKKNSCEEMRFLQEIRKYP